jgi:hypothetical protein
LNDEFTSSKLYHATRDEDALRRIDAQSQTTSASGLLALPNNEIDRQRSPARNVPAPKVGAGGSRPRVLDESAALQEEEARATT